MIGDVPFIFLESVPEQSSASQVGAAPQYTLSLLKLKPHISTLPMFFTLFRRRGWIVSAFLAHRGATSTTPAFLTSSQRSRTLLAPLTCYEWHSQLSPIQWRRTKLPARFLVFRFLGVCLISRITNETYEVSASCLCYHLVKSSHNANINLNFIAVFCEDLNYWRCPLRHLLWLSFS